MLFRSMEEHGFTTHRLPVTVTVYNTDGTVNKCSKITEYVEARMAVGEHAERVQEWSSWAMPTSSWDTTG